MAGYQPGLDEYKFHHKYRGLALIFVHETFADKSLSRRAGASTDATRMRTLFKNLDFKVKVYKDLSKAKIFEKLEKAADCKYNKDSDCFACVISTHGSEEKEKSAWKNCIYGYDGIPIFVDDILSRFSNNSCPNLADKPKLFFIQACRSRHAQPEHNYDFGCLVELIRQQSKESGQGDSGSQDSGDNFTRQLSKGNAEAEKDSQTDPANLSLSGLELGNSGEEQEQLDEVDDIQAIRNVVNIYKDWIEEPDDDELLEIPESVETEEDEADAGGEGDSGNIRETPIEVTPLQCPNDCLVVYPVMPGKTAFHSATSGSWMLHYMYENFHLLLLDFRLLPYLTRLCRDMANHEFKPRPLNENIYNPADYIVTKATALVVHRLSRDVRLLPKNSNTIMGLWFRKLNAKLLEKLPL